LKDARSHEFESWLQDQDDEDGPQAWRATSIEEKGPDCGGEGDEILRAQKGRAAVA